MPEALQAPEAFVEARERFGEAEFGEAKQGLHAESV